MRRLAQHLVRSLGCEVWGAESGAESGVRSLVPSLVQSLRCSVWGMESGAWSLVRSLVRSLECAESGAESEIQPGERL